MSMFNPPPPLSDLLLSILAAAAGRVTLMMRAAREATTWRSALRTLLWELPITVSLGLIGWALTDWLNLQGGAAFVLAAMLGRFGPDRLEPFFDGLLAQLIRKP
ncbi:hypothetical protein HMPREF9946_02559 [Acetobacteraceae bacterium AT-5844]|nr:hypothetical protein HMPREF9946_02559 [Acetobacteraceae bacterium AT-5844]